MSEITRNLPPCRICGTPSNRAPLGEMCQDSDDLHDFTLDLDYRLARLQAVTEQSIEYARSKLQAMEDEANDRMQRAEWGDDAA